MEGQQKEQYSRVLAGAAIGAAFVFLFTTKNGRRLLQSVDPWLDGVIRDMQKLRGTALKVRDVFDEGKRSLETVANLKSLKEDRSGNLVQTPYWPPESKH